jgi:hypothetical protein
MSKIDFPAVISEIASLAVTKVPEHPAEAAADGNALLSSARDRLQKYSDQLANKEIDQDELENDLSQDLLGLANMSKLQDAGLSQIRVSAFTEALVQILVRAAIVAAIGAI